jgi:hypothetical protein
MQNANDNYLPAPMHVTGWPILTALMFWRVSSLNHRSAWYVVNLRLSDVLDAKTNGIVAGSLMFHLSD